MGTYVNQKAIYLNVAGGKLKEKIGDHNGEPQYKESDGVTGVISGIRLKKSRFGSNPPVGKLQIRLADAHDASKPDFVLSGTVFLSDATVTTWGRMVVTRLINPGNTGPGDHLDFSVWTVEAGSRVSCGMVRLVGGSENFSAIEHEKSDPELSEKILTWIYQLIELYGDFSQNVDASDWDHPDQNAEESPAPATSGTYTSSGPRVQDVDEHGNEVSRTIKEQVAAVKAIEKESWSNDDDDDLPF